MKVIKKDMEALGPNIPAKQQQFMRKYKRRRDWTTVMIATPMYGGQCAAQYCRGIADIMNHAKESKVSIALQMRTGDSMITTARNELMHQFLQNKDFDFLFFIDADMGFTFEEFKKVLHLAAQEQVVVAGIYPKKRLNMNEARIMQSLQPGGDYYKEEYMGLFDGMVSVADGHHLMRGINIHATKAATGFMCIPRWVPRYIPLAQTPQYRLIHEAADQRAHRAYFINSISPTGLFNGEDHHFCELLERNKIPLWVDTSVCLRHVGSYVYSGNFNATDTELGKAAAATVE
jgi:hypothetical protein